MLYSDKISMYISLIVNCRYMKNLFLGGVYLATNFRNSGI